MAGRDDGLIAEPTFGADGTAAPAVPEPLTGVPREVGPVSVPRAWSTGSVAGRPAAGEPGGARRPAGARRGPVPGGRDEPPPRPRIKDEPSILGLTRHSHSRLGSRLFTLFFVLVYAVIVIELVVALVDG